MAPQPPSITQSPTSSPTVLVSPSPLPPISRSTAIEVPPPPSPSSLLQAPVPLGNPINTGTPQNAVPNSIVPSSESAATIPPQLAANHSVPTDTLESLPQGQSIQVKTNFGHFPYAENAKQRLVKVGVYYYDRPAFLDQDVADVFNQMMSDAKAQGVNLIIISGFRTIADQEKLFTRQVQRRGSQQAAAKLSAPAGFSEHHTGYAMDIGDGNSPKTDLKFEFENTAAYQWLAVNAHNYGFELSFPRNNPQGVSFEPWHWRYVSSQKANQIFAVARSL